MRISSLEGIATKKFKKQSPEKSIKTFFRKKQYYMGGEIPNLFSPKNIHIVQTIDIIGAVDYIYSRLNHISCPKNIKHPKSVSWQTYLVLKSNNYSKKRLIPKKHRGGLIILDFRYCYGFDV